MIWEMRLRIASRFCGLLLSPGRASESTSRELDESVDVEQLARSDKVAVTCARKVTLIDVLDDDGDETDRSKTSVNYLPQQSV